MWEAGNQVMLWAYHKGKGWSKKLSKKWTGPYTIFEVHSPQVVVLKEPNSRNWFTVNVERIKPFNAATPTTLNSSLNEGHYEVEEVLEEPTTDTGRHECKVNWVGYTNRHNSCVAEEDLHANCLFEQFQASRSSATTDRVWSTKDEEHSGWKGEVKAVAFPWNSNPHIPGIPTGDELHSVLNKGTLPSSSLACGLPSPTFSSQPT